MRLVNGGVFIKLLSSYPGGNEDIYLFHLIDHDSAVISQFLFWLSETNIKMTEREHGLLKRSITAMLNAQ